MQKIKLQQGEWTFDLSKPLGKPGGFGAVFAGFSDTHGELAVKRLHLAAGDAAHREMRIAADLAKRKLTHVMPVFDAGEDPDSGSYFVVMPKAERSLQNDLDQGVRFQDLDAARILLQILDGLIEVNDIVHRDLKPPNVLFHDGFWKVADFGIARFVEDSTSLRTLKECLSPPYAAPEQWQYIRAGGATDIYALGCIGYALLRGTPPFDGRTSDELRNQHLHADPPALAGCNPRLCSLLTMMLRKPAEARPNSERVRTILNDLISAPPTPVVPGFGMLAEAGANVARAQAEDERKQQQQLSASQLRNDLATAGRKVLSGIVGHLFTRIENEAPMAKRAAVASAISLGSGSLEFSVGLNRHNQQPGAMGAHAFPRSKWDVVASDEVRVRQIGRPYVWSSSLWYCKLPETAEYRWYETSYFAAFGGGDAFAPYSLIDRVGDADLAVAPIMHVHQVAFGPVPIDDENEDEFIERYSALLALASQGRLGHPSGLPLRGTFWRQPFVA